MNCELIIIFFLYTKLSSVADIISKFNNSDMRSDKKSLERTKFEDKEGKFIENNDTEIRKSNFCAQHAKNFSDNNIQSNVEHYANKSHMNVVAINKEIVNSVAESNGVNDSYSCKSYKQPPFNSLEQTNDPYRKPAIVGFTLKKKSYDNDVKTQVNEPMVNDKKLDPKELINQNDYEIGQASIEQNPLQEENAYFQYLKEKDLEKINELLESLRQLEDLTENKQSFSTQENEKFTVDAKRGLEELDSHANFLLELGNQTNLETVRSNQQIIFFSDTQKHNSNLKSNCRLGRCGNKKGINASFYQGETTLNMFGSAHVIHSNFSEENSKEIKADNDVKINNKTRKKNKSNIYCLICVSGNMSDDNDEEEKKLNAKKQLVY